MHDLLKKISALDELVNPTFSFSIFHNEISRENSAEYRHLVDSLKTIEEKLREIVASSLNAGIHITDIRNSKLTDFCKEILASIDRANLGQPNENLTPLTKYCDEMLESIEEQHLIVSPLKGHKRSTH